MVENHKTQLWRKLGKTIGGVAGESWWTVIGLRIGNIGMFEFEVENAFVNVVRHFLLLVVESELLCTRSEQTLEAWNVNWICNLFTFSFLLMEIEEWCLKDGTYLSATHLQAHGSTTCR